MPRYSDNTELHIISCSYSGIAIRHCTLLYFILVLNSYNVSTFRKLEQETIISRSANPIESKVCAMFFFLFSNYSRDWLITGQDLNYTITIEVLKCVLENIKGVCVWDEMVRNSFN